MIANAVLDPGRTAIQTTRRLFEQCTALDVDRELASRLEPLRDAASDIRGRPESAPWKLAAYSTAVLIVASVVPSPLERRSEWERVGPDKLLHFIGHAEHSVALANALGAGRYTDREAAVIAVSLSTTLGLVSGRLQRWVPGRAFEYEDVVAGLIGSILSVSWWYATDDSGLSPGHDW